MRLMACLCTLIATTSTPAMAGLIWRHLPQHAFSSWQAPRFADLDGDGINEIVFTAVDHELHSHGLGVLRRTNDGFELADLLSTDTLLSAIVVTPGADGRQTLVLSTHSGRTVIEVGRLPLRILRTWPDSVSIVPEHVGDIDDDGEWEIVGFTPHFATPYRAATAIDFGTGETAWTDHRIADALAVAQLDDSPALEIIAQGVSTGFILDGATGAEEWVYPSGFPGGIVAGRFSADPAVPTFASVQSNLTVFRGLPYSPVEEIPISGPVSWATAFDVDGDGIDNVIAAGLQIVDPTTGVIDTIPTPFIRATPAGIGRAEPGGPVFIAHSGGDIYPRLKQVQVIDFPQANDVLRTNVEVGPFSVAGLGDLDADGGPDIALVSARQTGDVDNLYQAGVSAWNSQGEPIGGRLDLGFGFSAVDDSQVHLADVDGEPGDEVIVAINYFDWNLLVVLDGRTFEDHWRIASYGGPDDALRTVRSIASADVDADGIEDVVTLAEHDVGARIVAFSGIDGQVLWRSVTLPVNTLWVDPMLTIYNIDADASPEILVAAGTGVYAFDVSTRLLDWTLVFPHEDLAMHVTAWGSAGDCRVGIGRQSDIMNVYSCTDLTEADQIELPMDATMIVPLDDRGSGFAVTAGGRLWTAAAQSTPEPYPQFLGQNLGGMPASALYVAPDGSTDILVGSSVHLSRIRMIETPLFADGFEPD